MTAKVYDFGKHQRQSSKKHGEQDHPTEQRSEQEIFMDTYNDVIWEWERWARRNLLSEFIRDRLSALIMDTPSVDLAHDLHALSQIEQRLQMKIGIFSPGTTKNNPFGWLVAFYTETDIFATPPDMGSEAHARAMNILLYVTFMMHMESLGRG